MDELRKEEGKGAKSGGEASICIFSRSPTSLIFDLVGADFHPHQQLRVRRSATFAAFWLAV